MWGIRPSFRCRARRIRWRPSTRPFRARGARTCVSFRAAIATTPVRPLTILGVDAPVTLPVPSWPAELFPQHSAVPFANAAHVCALPAATVKAPVRRPSPETAKGRAVFAVVPRPSSPSKLRPQHWTVPLFITAHEWEFPVVRPRAPARPVTGTGSEVGIPVGEPNCPDVSLPQQSAAPFVTSAQESELPVTTADAPVTFLTVTGTAESVSIGSVRKRLNGAPLPSWPELFRPQHRAVPSDNTAHECDPPAPMETTCVRPLTVTGLDESVVVPLPSCPEAFRPQHLTVPSAEPRARVCTARADRDDVGETGHR